MIYHQNSFKKKNKLIILKKIINKLKEKKKRKFYLLIISHLISLFQFQYIEKFFHRSSRTKIKYKTNKKKQKNPFQKIYPITILLHPTNLEFIK